jgi:homoserine kinase
VRLTVRVPATVANLGPGFDCLGLALSVYNEITVDTEAEPSITIEGEGEEELPADESNLVVRAMTRLAGKSERALPPVSVHCANRIPLERGLGSSAAAVVGGLLLAERILRIDLSRDALLPLIREFEGHLDNGAAALHGGVTLAYQRWADETWTAERLDPRPELRPVVLLNERERVSTVEARRILPRDVPFDAAVFNASRAALLVLALTSRPDLLGDAVRDALHQGPRLQLAPKSSQVFFRLLEEGVPVCVAGSGPTLLAFDTDERPVPDPGEGWRVLRPEVDRKGATLLEAA